MRNYSGKGSGREEKLGKILRTKVHLKFHLKTKNKFCPGKEEGKTQTLGKHLRCHMLHLGICEHQEGEDKSWKINWKGRLCSHHGLLVGQARKHRHSVGDQGEPLTM